MPFKKRQAKTGGRVAGTKNRKTRERDAAFADARVRAMLGVVMTPEQIEELIPLDVMKLVMRHRLHAGDLDGAAAAANQLAPYLHARLASVDVKVMQKHDRLSDEQLL